MEQEEIDKYARRLAPTLSTEAHSMLTVASLVGMLKIKKGEAESVDDALVGGIVVIHGNSLVAAYYRELNDKPFDRKTYFMFPVFKSQMHETIKKLAGGKAPARLPEYRKDRLNACIFYGSGYSVVEIPEDKSEEGISATAEQVGEKIAMLPNGKEVMELFINMFGGNA